jgi:tetratricopeptide (TPR) repeat protein
MEFIPSMKVDRHPLAGQGCDRVATLNGDRLLALSSWIMVLGTVRFLCAFADYLSAFLSAYRFEPVSLRMLSRFIEENQPVIALSVVWPLVIGIALRRTRWPELLFASGVTFLILSLGGALELIAGWSHARGDGITVGSFQLTRRALLHPTFSDVTLGLLGATQLVLECATALRCLQMAHSNRSARANTQEFDRHEGLRRARFGRLAVYTSLGFLVLMIRLPIWSTYLEVLNESRIFREFVLKDDIKRIKSAPRSRRASREEMEVRNLHILLGAGFGAARSTNYLEAKESYLRVIARAESASEKPLPPGLDGAIAQARNNLAWLLATCPATELRDPREAVEQARRATALDSKQGNYWNTLGVAYYRNGQLDEAKNALYRSMSLRNEGDSFDWFFLALVELKQGHRPQAQEWFERATRWFRESHPNDPELRLFHSEAAQALGLSSSKPPTQTIAVRRLR